MSLEGARQLGPVKVSIQAKADFTLCETGLLIRLTVQDQLTAQVIILPKLTASHSVCPGKQ